METRGKHSFSIPYVLLLIVLSQLIPTTVKAACTSPVDVAGKISKQSTTLQLSDGCIWNTLNRTTTATTCSKTGSLQANGSTAVQWCDGAHWVTLGDNTSQKNGSCSAQGKIQYDSTAAWLQWCDGSDWRAMQPQYSSGKSTGNYGDYSDWGTPVSSMQTASLGTTTTGNAIICASQYNIGAPVPSISSVTDTAGNSYQRAILHTWTFGDEIWYSTNITGGANFKVTAAFSTATGGMFACGEFSGIVATNALDQTSFQELYIGSGKYVSATPSVTTTSAKELVFAFTSNSACGGMQGVFNYIGGPGCNNMDYFWTRKGGNYTFRGSSSGDAAYYLATFRTTATATAPALHDCFFFLTSGSSWTVPDDWNNSNNYVMVIGGGGGGATYATNGGGGGGGGAYALTTNITFTAGASVPYTVGTGGAAGLAGGDTYFNGVTCAASSACAKGGSGGSTTTGGTGGLASASVGGSKKSGGIGNNENTTVAKGGGGGGAAGPTAAGKPTSAGGTSQTGGQANGSGATGGSAGQPGNVGGEWAPEFGSGAGGGGGNNGGNGGAGASYGGGGGGSGKGGVGGTGGGGLIVIYNNGTVCE